MSEGPVRLTQFSKGGGCGCKIAPAVLQQILSHKEASSFPHLLVGHATADDAAVYELNEETAVISTTDFFVPIVDDAFDFGRIAASNAISDVYAMGGSPLMAVAILGFPVDKLPLELAQQILAGGRAVCTEAGIPLAGGHSIDSSEPIFGLAVTGTVIKNQLKRNVGAQPGDLLYLTKPLGSGLISTALKRGQLPEEYYAPFIEQVSRLNKIGEALGKLNGVHALTDVTGFGLLGHLLEMANGSDISVELDYNKLQKMQGVEFCLQQRSVPDATYRNWNSYNTQVQFEKGVNVMEAFTLLPDPQTNGGLLVAASQECISEIDLLFNQFELQTFMEPIGSIVERREKAILVR